MRAIVLAGGEGRRLYPYTLVLPKPLVPIGDRSIMEIVVRQLSSHGFDHITCAVGYHADLVMAVFGEGEKWNVRMDYVVEENPLGTIGPLTTINHSDEPFLVMNGDLLTDLNYHDLMEYHKQNQCIATIATCKRHVKLSLGVVSYDEQRRMTGFEEKPEFDYDVSMGVYVFDPRVQDYIPKNQAFGFDQLMHKLLEANEKAAVYPFDGHWLDMGTYDDLNEANQEFEKHRTRYLPHE